MPPKAKGKRVEKKKQLLNEKETLSYEQQILDNNRQLARLRTRNEELECEVKIVKQRFHQLDEDRSDVIAYLKRTLEEKTQEARELTERLSALGELRNHELESFKKIETAMELEYQNMENNLTAELKLADGKLSALEDWRVARLDILQKFEAQQRQIKEQEESHKNLLYETEKTITVGKAKMQEDMEQHLNELAQSFRNATNIRIADTTHRAVRENIALNWEIDTMFKICTDLELQNKQLKEKHEIYKFKADLLKEENKIVMNKVGKQRETMESLVEKYKDINLKYMTTKRVMEKSNYYQDLIKQFEERCKETKFKISTVQKNLKEIRISKQHIVAECDKRDKECDMLRKILNEAKHCITEALQLQLPADDPCTSCCVDVKEMLLQTLLSILEIRVTTESESQVTDMKAQYTQGKLGLLQATVPVDLNMHSNGHMQ